MQVGELQSSGWAPIFEKRNFWRKQKWSYHRGRKKNKKLHSVSMILLSSLTNVYFNWCLSKAQCWEPKKYRARRNSGGASQTPSQERPSLPAPRALAVSWERDPQPDIIRNSVAGLGCVCKLNNTPAEASRPYYLSKHLIACGLYLAYSVVMWLKTERLSHLSKKTRRQILTYIAWETQIKYNNFTCHQTFFSPNHWINLGHALQKRILSNLSLAVCIFFPIDRSAYGAYKIT